MLVAAVTLLWAIGASAATDKQLEIRVDKYLAPLVKAHDFNGVVIVARDDKILAQKAYGQADFDLNVPIVVRSRFRIASMTKAFTGAAVAMLAERPRVQASSVDSLPMVLRSATQNVLVSPQEGDPRAITAPLFQPRSTMPLQGQST
ncbi:MAG TPA: serine hydrolase domain-containing protein [Thermoanaerobaculia bacterium]|nr:serine hydrolase domain-containing protein [Thermoanaerobaculia bacterium]